MLVSHCRCMYIPSQVLESLATAGVETARDSIEQSERSRGQRSARVASAAVISTAGEGPREVWDCENQWVQRVTLARGESGPATADQAVTNAYNFGGKVRAYFNTLDRNSYDNVGSKLIVNVNFGTSYMNAFWDGDELTIGNGDGAIFVDFARSLDVIAHEFTHGVVQFTAGLVYQGQSGALNESFADVFGSAITQRDKGQTAHGADWLIGDEIMGPTLYGESLRSMREPGTAYDNPLMGKDPQPAHMNDYYSGPGDNQGVHINSGIINKAFYLVAMDKGTDNAARIWYHALQNLEANADFNDAVGVIVNSAQVLTKVLEVPLGSTQTVRAAFKAVGLPT